MGSRRRTPPSARRATRTTPTGCPAGRAGGSAAAVAAGFVPLALGLRHGRLDPPARRAVRGRRREADLRARSRATGWSPSPARSTRSGRSRHRRRRRGSALRRDRRSRPAATRTSLRRPADPALVRRSTTGSRGCGSASSPRLVDGLSRPSGRRGCSEAAEALAAAGAKVDEVSVPELTLRPLGLLPDRPGRGVVEPRPLRRRALRAAGRRRRRRRR